MSLIIFIFASILLSIITYWMSLLAVIVTVLKGYGEIKTVTIVAVAALLNYFWLVLLGAVEGGKLPGYVLMHWMITAIIVALVCYGIRWFRANLRETADSAHS